MFFNCFGLTQVNLKLDSLTKSTPGRSDNYATNFDTIPNDTQNIKMILNGYFTGLNLLDPFRKRLPTCGPSLPLSIQEFHDEIIEKNKDKEFYNNTEKKKTLLKKPSKLYKKIIL